MTPAVKFPVEFGPHAVERYQERLRPALSIEGAEIELERIANHARLSSDPPTWVGSDRDDSPIFLSVGDATFPLSLTRDGTAFRARTCLVRGSLSPQARERRNQRRRVANRSPWSQIPGRIRFSG